MKTTYLLTAITGLAVLATFAPAAFADHDNDRYGYNQNHRYQNSWQQERNAKMHARNVRRASRVQNCKVNNSNSWKWEQHNWDDQSAHMRANWRENNADRLSSLQQQQLDDQMRAQWRSYHHNNWNGQYSWDQYNDPNFLNYLHTNSPSILTTLRTRFGF
jgi:hypothetical protein